MPSAHRLHPGQTEEAAPARAARQDVQHRDAGWQGLHHHQRERRAAALRGVHQHRQGRLGDCRGLRGHWTADLLHPAPGFAHSSDRAHARSRAAVDRHRRRTFAGLRPEPCALPARWHRTGAGSVPAAKGGPSVERCVAERPDDKIGHAIEAEAESAGQANRIGDLCPECGEAAVVNEEGCRKCYACGYSEC